MPMNTLLATIQALEVELHHPGVRCDVARLDQLLHPDFHEVGRSGRQYDRPTVMRFLAEEGGAPAIESSDFRLGQLATDTVLLTYRSAHRLPDGQWQTHTLRSSVWVKHEELWRLRYHQGTPAAKPW
jgi:hypothetical protein